jgi:hypothetical protein
MSVKLGNSTKMTTRVWSLSIIEILSTKAVPRGRSTPSKAGPFKPWSLAVPKIVRANLPNVYIGKRKRNAPAFREPAAGTMHRLMACVAAHVLNSEHQMLEHRTKDQC